MQTGTSSFGVSAFGELPIEVRTVPHSVDSVLKQTINGSHGLDAVIIEPTKTRTHLVDATIFEPTKTKTHSADSVLRDTFTRTHSVDAFLSVLKKHSVDALLRETWIKTHSTDAVLLETWTKTLNVDSVLKNTWTKDYIVDANIIALPRFVDIATGTGTYSVTVSTTPIEGEVMIAQVNCRPTQTVSVVPTGWTLVRSDVTTDTTYEGTRQYVYYKVAGASETGSYTWEFINA